MMAAVAVDGTTGTANSVGRRRPRLPQLPRVRGAWAWALLPVGSAAAIGFGLAMLAVDYSPDGATQGEILVNVPFGLGFTAIAAAVLALRPHDVGARRLGRLYLVVGTTCSLVLPVHGIARHLLLVEGSRSEVALAFGWVSSWLWAFGVAPLLGLGLLLHPDGRLPGPRWRPALVAGATAPVLLAVSAGLHPGAMDGDLPADNPLGLPWGAAPTEILGGLGFLLFLGASAAGLAALVVRFRRAAPDSETRAQIWAFGAASALLLLAASLPSHRGWAAALIPVVLGAALPAAVAVAAFQHGMFRAPAVEALAARLASTTRSRAEIVSAQQEERRRLRRDLHDGLGPSLAAVGLGLRRIGGHLEPGSPDADIVQALADEVQRAVAEVRRVCEGLRPPALDDLGLVGAVRQVASRLAPDGVPTILVEGVRLPELGAAAEVASYRIAVEAATNAVRHAGAAAVSVRIEGTADGLLVRVGDDGHGLGAERSGGIGMGAMVERAAELGGTLTVVTAPQGGTVVTAFLPTAAGASASTAAAHPAPVVTA